MAEATTEYRVRIHYREPGYERMTGPRGRPYHWTYDVVAPSAAIARDRALDEFERMAAHSSVGWIRQVILVELSETVRAAQVSSIS